MKPWFSLRNIGIDFVERDHTRMSLEQIARKLMWWKSPVETLADKQRFLAQVMVYGTVADVLEAQQRFSRQDFINTLPHPPAGVFDERSWVYWRLVYGLPEQPLPKRF